MDKNVAQKSSRTNALKDVLRMARLSDDYKTKLIPALAGDLSELIGIFERLKKELTSSDDTIERIHKFIKSWLDEKGKSETHLKLQILEGRKDFLSISRSNDALKIEYMTLMRKYQASLILGKVKDDAIEHFLATNPKAVSCLSDVCSVYFRQDDCDQINHIQDPFVVNHKLMLVSKQLENMDKLYSNDVSSLKSDLELLQAEYDVQKEEYLLHIREITKHLLDSRKLLQDSLAQNISYQEQNIMMQASALKSSISNEQKGERKDSSSGESSDSLLNVLESSSKSCKTKSKSLPTSTERRLAEKVSHLEMQLLSKENELDKCNMEYKTISKELGIEREKRAKLQAKSQNAIRSLESRIEVMSKQYKDLEARRSLDNAGFRADVQALRKSIESIERKWCLYVVRKRRNVSNAQNQIRKSEKYNHIAKDTDVQDGKENEEEEIVTLDVFRHALKSIHNKLDSIMHEKLY